MPITLAVSLLLRQCMGRGEVLLQCILRKRLQPISKRTLRGQVQEVGHINYTNRIARTFDFEAGNER